MTIRTPLTAHFDAVCFDAFGTLFDVSWQTISTDRISATQLQDVIDTWRMKQLQSSWLMNSMGVYKPFDELSGEALEKSFAIHGIDSTDLFQDLLQQVLNPGVFSDVTENISLLKEQGIGTAILSNGSSEMLASVVNASGLDVLIDQIISVDEVEVYKPAPEVYSLPSKRLQVGFERLLFVSSNQWDVTGAMYAGLQAAWLNRTASDWEELDIQPSLIVPSLRDLAMA
ncbi:MAG: haloacid dehalogenase type II [Saprospiraceae bacterium]|nr:haloacid dehalogenase type II [Saprospiraceae bacterium]